MFRYRILVLIGFSGPAIVMACPAMADVYSVTYTGTASGTDTFGLFGAAGATLSGVSFTSTYTYDPSRFGDATQTTGHQTSVEGGSGQGTTDPILSAILEINGETFNQSSSYEGEQYLQGVTYSPYIMTDAHSSSSNYLQDDVYASAAIKLSFKAVQSVMGTSSYGLFAYNGESIKLNDTHLSIADIGPSPIPEPPSLPLLAVAASVLALVPARRRTKIDCQTQGQRAIRNVG